MNTANSNVERIRGRAWMELRERILTRDGYLCVPCKARGLLTIAREIDHVVALEAGGDNSTENLQAICTDCHQNKTNSESAGAAVAAIPWHLKRVEGRPVITIAGPHYCGKTDMALDMARPGDKVVNINEIAKLTCGRPFHAGLTTEQRRAVLRTRNKALKTYLDGDHYERCINVTPAPSFKERQFWRSISEQVVVIDYDPDDCQRRAERDLLGSDDLPGVLREVVGWE